MIDLKPLITFLRIVSLLGLIVTTCMMMAVIYKKMKEYYPVQVQKYRWAFITVAGLLSMLFIFLFQKYFNKV